MATSVYRGFSSKNWLKTRSFKLQGVDLVKQDLLNHIYTVRGERVMMPAFGTRIPIMAFEPQDDKTRSVIDVDLQEVFYYDPRVDLISLQIDSVPNENKMIAAALLFFKEFDVTDELRIEVPTL